MSFKEVTALRRAGRLQEAYNMAKADLAEEQSEWTLSAMFWVLSEQSKVFLSSSEIDKARISLRTMKDLLENMNDSEGFARRAVDALQRKLEPNWDIVNQMSEWSKSGHEEEAYQKLIEIHKQESLNDTLHEDFGWVIFRYLNHCYEQIGSANARKALNTYLNLNNTRPSKLHSQILNLSTKISEKYEDFKFLPFLKMWNVHFLSSEDFRSSYWEGKQISPLVERVIDRCFSLGYSLQDVIDAFTENPDIKVCSVCDIFSKHSFFEIQKLYHEDLSLLLANANNYFNAIKDKDINNEFHSKILSMYLRKLPEERVSEAIKSINSWGLGNFRDEDWKREKNEEKEFPSLVEKATSQYLQALKLCQYKDVNDEFIAFLYEVINHYTDNDQYERHLAQIFLAKGDKEEALTVYRHLLLKLNRFYVWKELAEATDDVELKISALCKAILSEPNDDYLGEVHLALAKTLISTNQKVIAKRELNKFKETYQRKGWKPKEGYILMSKEISDITDTSSDNKDFYSAHLFPAEEFVYSEIEWTTMVVSDVYKQKKDGRERERAKLVSADGKEVSVRFETLKTKAKNAIASCYDVKIIDHDDDRYDIGMIRKSEKTIIDVFTPMTCYVDYHNKERKCYHLITNDNKQVVLSQQVELKEGQFCSCFIMPQKENDKTELPIHALFSRIEDPKTALQSFTMRTAVVDHVNKSKQLFHCVFGRGMDIIVNFSQTDLRPQIGDYVQIRYVRKKLKDGRVIRKMLSIEPTDSCEKELKRTVKGYIRLNVNSKGQQFGFVEDYYVPSHLLEEVQEYDQVEVDIVYNGEKWVVYNLKNQK